MQQMSPQDAIFLSIETPETPSVIGGLAILDPRSDDGMDFDAFLALLGERLALCPRFSWRLQEVPFGLDLPYWVEDGELDLREHVRRVALPAPGGNAELAELAGYLYSRPLDRRLPLWEFFFIEGLQGGRVALLWKVHHCLMDGVSGAGLVEILFDLAPEPGDRPLVPTDETASVGGRASTFDLAANGLRNMTRRQQATVRHLSRTARDAFETVRNEGLAGLSSNVPRTSFNGEVGAKRAVGWTSVSLHHVKSLARRLDVKVNDVLLSITGSGVKRYLEDRDEMPEESLHAYVPMSTRSEGDDSIGNQVRELAVSWATDVECPIERLHAIHGHAMESKRQARRGGASLTEVLAESLPPAAIGWIARNGAANPDSTPLPGNAVVSNVAASPMPLYIAGARIVGMVPMSVLAPTQGLNITAVSYCEEIFIGITVDPDLVPTPSTIADAIPKALLELQRAAEDWTGATQG